MQSLLLLLIISPIWQQQSSILRRDSAAGGIVAAFTFHSPSSTSSSSSLSITRIGQHITVSHPKDQHFKPARGALYSTPFDLDLYNDNNGDGDDDDSNNIDIEQEDLRPPLAAPPRGWWSGRGWQPSSPVCRTRAGPGSGPDGKP